jgi:DNA-binding transcriptional ArsR family regulator
LVPDSLKEAARKAASSLPNVKQRIFRHFNERFSGQAHRVKLNVEVFIVIFTKGTTTAMLEQFIISDIKQLKALSHASRVKILHFLAEKPMTAKQLADQFGEEPAKTSYHVKQLLKVGLVELKFTRETQNGIIEKYYLAIAKEFQTDPYLARQPEGRSHLETGFLRELNKTQSDFLRAYRQDLDQQVTSDLSTAHGLYRISLGAEQLPTFVAELQKLVERFEDPDGAFAFQYLAFPAGDKRN